MKYLDLHYKGSWGEGRTETYRGTVTDKNDPELLLLKKNTKMNNRYKIDNAFRACRRLVEYGYNEEHLAESINGMFSWNPPQSVRLFGRGPRRDENNKPLHWNCDSNLQHKYATRFDVYVLDADKYRLKERLRKEFTPNLHKIEELQWQIKQLEWNMKKVS